MQEAQLVTHKSEIIRQKTILESSRYITNQSIRAYAWAYVTLPTLQHQNRGLLTINLHARPVPTLSTSRQDLLTCSSHEPYGHSLDLLHLALSFTSYRYSPVSRVNVTCPYCLGCPSWIIKAAGFESVLWNDRHLLQSIQRYPMTVQCYLLP